MFNIKKIIIAVVVIVMAFAGYTYFISGNTGGSASGVTRQAVSTTSAGTASSAALDGPGKEFVSQLLAIQNIRFNLDLFNDPVFKGLQDWSREILPQESGRPNPFAPLEGDTGGTQAAGGAGFSGNISSDSSAPSGTSNFAASSSASGSAAAKVPARTTPAKPVPSRTSGAVAR
jgi:hypothetical protein